VTRTAERLAVVNMALVNEDEAVPRKMIEHFSGCAQWLRRELSFFLISCRILIDNLLELIKISKRATWKKILESEEDKKKIAETFERIDEHTKNFHVCSPINLN
jgi:hypothetical protein